MELEQAEFLKQAAEYVGNQDVEIVPDYAGRGMRGETTCALIVDNVAMLMVDVIDFLRQVIRDNPSFLEEIPDFDDLRTDSCATRTILY